MPLNTTIDKISKIDITSKLRGENKLQCLSCSKRMRRIKQNHNYTESGLRNITLKNVEVMVCDQCDEEEVIISNVEQLQELIAMNIASQSYRLLPEEVRFLRVSLGFSGAQFAELLKVNGATVSRWENGKEKIGPANELALRLLILGRAGPIREYDEIREFGKSQKKTPAKRLFVTRKNEWRDAA